MSVTQSLKRLLCWIGLHDFVVVPTDTLGTPMHIVCKRCRKKEWSW